jgi:hypothetical protein
MVIFFGHGGGPLGLFLDRACATCEPQSLTLRELRESFGHAHAQVFRRPVDILMAKDCFMGTLEMLCEIKDAAKYAITSQAAINALGWPYAEILGCLASGRDPASRTEAIARELVNVLGLYYDRAENRLRTASNKDEVPWALHDLAHVRAVETLVKQLVSELRRALTDPEARALTREVLARSARADGTLVDVMVLCDYLEGLRGSASRATEIRLKAIRRVAARLARVSKTRLVVERRPEQSAFGGTSLFYFPMAHDSQQSSLFAPRFVMEPTISEDYLRLRLSTDTRWGEIALEMLTHT